MRSIMVLTVMLGLSLYAVAQCDKSVLVIHNTANLQMKVYVDGSTGTNAPTAAVTVTGIPPGQHLLKVVAVYTDEPGSTKRRVIFNGNINFRGSRYMDAWVEPSKGISIHETSEPCDGQVPEGTEPPINPNAPQFDQNNTSAGNNQQPDNNGGYQPAPAQGSNDARASIHLNMPPHISDDDFARIKNIIVNTQYETKKLDTLKLLTANDQFATDQVSQLMSMFSFGSNKLEVAKLLYDKTVDKQNYSQLAVYFNFDSSKEAFRKFMEGK
jgi:hypothetical protein